MIDNYFFPFDFYFRWEQEVMVDFISIWSILRRCKTRAIIQTHFCSRQVVRRLGNELFSHRKIV